MAEAIDHMRYGVKSAPGGPYGFDAKMVSEFASAAAGGDAVRMKATVTTTTGGVSPSYLPGTIGSLSEPFRVRNMFREEQVDSPSTWFRRITTASAQAATVAEGAAKPEATIVASNVEAPTRKIAVFLPVNEEVVDDGGAQFVSALTADLIRDLISTENEQLLAGSGTAPDLRGILNTTGIQTRARGTDSNLDAIIKGVGPPGGPVVRRGRP